jgi:hypothetical protein
LLSSLIAGCLSARVTNGTYVIHFSFSNKYAANGALQDVTFQRVLRGNG